jgi:hypothetical protein
MPDQKHRNGPHQRRNLIFGRKLALNRGGNVRIVNHWRNDRPTLQTLGLT